MKQLKFNLDNLFRLSTISAVQTFELENNSTELIISTDVKAELAYELHIENGEEKSFVILEKADGAVKCLLNSGMLKLGVNKLQLRGIGANDYSIESNRVEFTVKSFINASVEPEPSEQTAFEKLVVEVNVLKNDVDILSDKIDSTESAIAALGAELELEKINRANSDSLLDSKIEEEREAREMEDSSIKNSIQNIENAKQDKLVAGENIAIEGNVISAKGGGGTGDVTKEYLQENYYDKPFINEWDSLVVNPDAEDVNVVEERDISYSNIPMYCGKWVDGKDIHRRVYVVTSGIAKGNTIKVADKPANMEFLVRGFGIVEGTASATKHTMTNSDISVYVNNDGVYAINNFTGYAERLYIVLEYTVSGGAV